MYCILVLLSKSLSLFSVIIVEECIALLTEERPVSGGVQCTEQWGAQVGAHGTGISWTGMFTKEDVTHGKILWHFKRMQVTDLTMHTSSTWPYGYHPDIVLRRQH